LLTYRPSTLQAPSEPHVDRREKKCIRKRDIERPRFFAPGPTETIIHPSGAQCCFSASTWNATVSGTILETANLGGTMRAKTMVSLVLLPGCSRKASDPIIGKWTVAGISLDASATDPKAVTYTPVAASAMGGLTKEYLSDGTLTGPTGKTYKWRRIDSSNIEENGVSERVVIEGSDLYIKTNKPNAGWQHWTRFK
jgi:hypothetical protein